MKDYIKVVLLFVGVLFLAAVLVYPFNGEARAERRTEREAEIEAAYEEGYSNGWNDCCEEYGIEEEIP